MTKKQTGPTPPPVLAKRLRFLAAVVTDAATHAVAVGPEGASVNPARIALLHEAANLIDLQTARLTALEAAAWRCIGPCQTAALHGGGRVEVTLVADAVRELFAVLGAHVPK